MAFSEEDVRKNREYFAEKLRAERQLTDVQAWAKKEPGAPQIALLDTRSRDAFAILDTREWTGKRPGQSQLPSA